MSRTLQLLALLGAITGCDQVFGLSRGDAGTDTPGEPQPVILGLVVEGQVVSGETVKLSATLRHDPNELVTVGVFATAGSFAMATGTILLDASGNGSLEVDYTAPATGASAILSATALGDTKSITVPISVLTIYGDDGLGTSTATRGPNEAFGEKLVITQPCTIRSLGVYITNPLGRIKMALYRDSGGPRTLVAATAEQDQISGRNVLPAPSAPIPAGTYYVFSVVDTDTTFQMRDAGSYFEGGTNYAQGFPSLYQTNSFSETVDSHPMMFVGVVN